MNPFGNTFLDVPGQKFYEVRLHYNDIHDAVARILVDGQDAFNRFNTDKVKYTGLLVEPGKSSVLKGWFHSSKKNIKDNVFAFAVKEYGVGGPTTTKALGEVGVITVQFAVAWKEGTARPAGRAIGRETDKGPGVAQDFQVERRHIGEFNQTIAVRYSLTAK